MYIIVCRNPMINNKIDCLDIGKLDGLRRKANWHISRVYRTADGEICYIKSPDEHIWELLRESKESFTRHFMKEKNDT